MILRARIVLPISRPPIEDGAVCISGNRISAVGAWSDLAGRHHGDVFDLGEVILMPGLVNSHCHLDYTNMGGLFSPPKQFTDWIKLVTTEKAGWSYSDFAKSWLEGAKMLVRTGTTIVADVETVYELLPDVWESTPLRVISFLEMTGVKSRRAPRAILDEAVAKIDSLPQGRCAAGLSPHAPYSTTPELFRLSAEAARKRHWLLTTHIAETDEEFEMFRHKRGSMFDWLKRNDRDMSDCGGVSPVQHALRHRLLGKNLLAIHVNYLVPGDAESLARRKVNVVHCPRSHAYFKHDRLALKPLKAAGVNVCLGTDSLASVRKERKEPLELNLFSEMRMLATNLPRLSSETILEMATVNGAKALGRARQIGEVTADACADLIAIPFADKTRDAVDAVVHHKGDVAASMIDGRWVIPPVSNS